MASVSISRLNTPPMPTVACWTAGILARIIDTISEGSISGDGEAGDIVAELARYGEETKRSVANKLTPEAKH